jgi:hypothetical protein
MGDQLIINQHRLIQCISSIYEKVSMKLLYYVTKLIMIISVLKYISRNVSKQFNFTFAF